MNVLGGMLKQCYIAKITTGNSCGNEIIFVTQCYPRRGRAAPRTLGTRVVYTEIAASQKAQIGRFVTRDAYRKRWETSAYTIRSYRLRIVVI